MDLNVVDLGESMSFLSWLADQLILCPSKHAIDFDGKRRELIDSPFGHVEAWVGRYPEDSASEVNVTVIKFPGTAGRAERAGVHPAEVWGVNAEVWTINPHGYGGSSGRASIKKFPAMASAVHRHVAAVAPDRPIVVVGNSLGCVSALYTAANHKIDALIVRNPAPVRNMIRNRPRYRAWNFGLSGFIADEVPHQLDSIANSAACTAPCLFIQSGADRVIPLPYQDLVFDAYSGPIRKFVIQGADHHELVGENQQQEYFEALHWAAAQAGLDVTPT